MAMPNGFSVCVLLYGDNVALANRCLGSLITRMDPSLVHSLRVGLNAVSPATRAAALYWLRQCPVQQVLVFEPGFNALKYPLMRRMFHTPQYPITTQFLMWFDDDSCLAPETDRNWWSQVHMKMQESDMIGDLYTKQIEGNQAAGVAAQSWYRRATVPAKAHRFRFATGGWWSIRTRIVQRYNYPFPELKHNGGDTVLGELFRQQVLRLNQFRDGVWINADESGKSAKAPRRGVSQRAVWFDYVHGRPVNTDHQTFACTVYDPREMETAPPVPESTVPAAPASVPAIRLPGLV